MERELLKNGEGYDDYTAYKAIIKAEKEKKMEIYEGDIFIGINNKTGQEREYLIVKVHDKFSTVLMLTTDESLRYSVMCNGMRYYHPGYIQYIFNDNLTEFVRSLKNKEFEEVKKNIAETLGISIEPVEVIKEVPVEVIKEVQPSNREALSAAVTEAKIYKELYEKLFEKVVKS